VSNYEYQKTSALKLVQDATSKGVKAAVFAAAPGAGKTVTSHICINEYLKLFPYAKVLVLTHGQNLLKNQYLESLQNPKTKINFTFGDFSSEAQVRIGIPHSIKKLNWSKIDLLIVDECHEFYLKKMVQNIINNLQPSHQILLTGSPSVFNKKLQKGEPYKITYIHGEELLNKNVFSSVDMDVVSVAFKGNTAECLKLMLEHAKKQNKNMSKIMVAVKTINEAKNAEMFLKSVGRNVVVSTSENDPNNHAVSSFKNNLHDTLVVVQKGILGFSDNYITGILDLRNSEDPEISNQLFARVLRKHPDNVFKFYYRCGVKKTPDYNNQVIMLHKIKGLMRKDIFKNYNGDNLKIEITA
jgi:hypothetical protein